MNRVVTFGLGLLAWGITARAEPITLARINELPVAVRSNWTIYWERSQTKAQAYLAALQAEVSAQKLPAAIRAPEGGDFRIPATADDDWFRSTEAGALVDTILSYQTPAGGWSKHNGYSKGPRQPGMQWTSQNEPGKSPHYVATFDNHATTGEMEFLARMWQATQREDCQAGFIKGLNFIFEAQMPNGGWPQVYPLEGGYHDAITFNDDAMTRVLELLHAVVGNDPVFSFLDRAQQEQAATALKRGIQCVLEAQIIQDGKKTVWCAQHDALTLQPAQARKLEPPTLSGAESARLLSFLMTITNPAPEIVASIEQGLGWLDRVKITNLTKTRREGKTVYETNPDSTEVYWARFYDLTNSKPVFPGRDGVVYETFAAMVASNRVGYDYFTTQPGSVLNTGQKKWRKMLAGPSKKTPPATQP